MQRWPVSFRGSLAYWLRAGILAQEVAEALRLPGSVSLTIRSGRAALRPVSLPVKAGVMSKGCDWDEMG